jgi:hypothetical protein
MNGRLARFFGIGIVALLLAASVGVIFWIVRDEQSRLTERERFALEAADRMTAEEAPLETSDQAANEDAKKMLHEISTLLNSLSSDDLPAED